MPRSKIIIVFLFLLVAACKLSKTDRLMNKGITAATKGKFDKAEIYFTRAIRADSNNLDAFFNRGSANNDMHYYNKALEDYSYLRSKNYDNPDLYYNMGLNYYDLNKLDSALVAYTKAIAMDSTDFDYYIGKGTTLSDLKHYDKALVEYDRALKMKPKDITVLKDLGYTYYEMGEFQLSKKYILDAIDNGLTEAEYFLKFALIYEKSDDKNNACKYFTLARQHLKEGQSLSTSLKMNCK